MIAFVLRRILTNAWMVLCLLAGSILAVALIVSIPVYTEGILQRLLTRDLEEFQVTQGVFPGRCEVSRSFVMPDEPDRKFPLFTELDERIGRRLAPSLGVPFLVSTVQLTLDFLVVDQQGAGGEASGGEAATFVRMEGLRGFADRIRIVAGRAASPDDEGGEIEAVISEQAQQVLGLYLDRVYDVRDAFYGTGRLARVRIVGVYTVQDPQDPFWFRGLGEFEKSLMVDADLLERRFVAVNSPNFASARWFFALDYHAIRIGDVPGMVARIKDFRRLAEQQRMAWDLPILELLDEYTSRASVLRLTLWFLEVPVLLMLAFFIYMVSQLIIEGDANEIAVLKSRGSSSAQVFLLYLLESVLLAAAWPSARGRPRAATSASSSARRAASSSSCGAPPSRTPSARAYGYALLGAALFIAAMLLSGLRRRRAPPSSSTSGSRDGRAGAPFWQRFFLDAVLLVVAAVRPVQLPFAAERS